MYYLDLFSGIGGFALGAYWAGWRFDEHYFSEIDNYCIAIYNLRFPDSIALGDIRHIDANNFPPNDWIITGGFPCQDISIAGHGRGIKGARSSLWFEMWRIIGLLRPRFAIIENVGAITHRGLDTVLGNLAEIGYDAEWQDIRASDVGAPHKRERIWIVAYPQSMDDTWGKEKKDRWTMGECGESRRYLWGNTRPQPCRMDDGLFRGLDRLKALGNSIVPQIAELLFRRLKEIVENE